MYFYIICSTSYLKKIQTLIVSKVFAISLFTRHTLLTDLIVIYIRMLHKLLKKELKKIQINHLDDYIRLNTFLESGFALYGVTRGDVW